jgi:hypothetical protein
MKRCEKPYLVAGMIWAKRFTSIYELISNHINPFDHPSTGSFADLAIQFWLGILSQWGIGFDRGSHSRTAPSR